ncbi:MAG TPA: HAD family hydrolase [Anaerolineales bacterium]|nr:HAD family hydrolase [Anaerolineales bacterium]
MPAWRAVGFDLDDTLYPERAFVLSGFAAAAEWLEGETGTAAQETLAQLTDLFEAGVRGDTFDRWLRSQQLPVAAYRAGMIQAYRKHKPRLSPFADVPPALERLRANYRLGLATEGARAVQEAKLEAIGVRDRFDAVILLGEEERSQWKPNPWPLTRLAEALQISPKGMVYVGDNPQKDFEAARRAGMTSVRLRRSEGLHAGEEPATPDAAPDAEVADMKGLISWLTGGRTAA